MRVPDHVPCAGGGHCRAVSSDRQRRRPLPQHRAKALGVFEGPGGALTGLGRGVEVARVTKVLLPTEAAELEAELGDGVQGHEADLLLLQRGPSAGKIAGRPDCHLLVNRDPGGVHNAGHQGRLLLDEFVRQGKAFFEAPNAA